MYTIFVSIPLNVSSAHTPTHPQILCLLPSGVVSWLALLGAGAVSGLFLLRNLAALVTTHARQHEAVILGSLGLIQLCFSLALKVFFYYK